MITRFRLKVAAAIAALVLLGVIGYGAGVYLGFFAIPFVSNPPEHSARYYPDDVIAYSWMTLNPGGGQRRHMTEMLNQMRDISTVREWEEEIEDALDDALDVDFEDIAEWVGTDLSMAVLDFDNRSQTVDVAGTIDVRNREAAEDFLDRLLDRLEEESGFDFDKDDYGDFDTWVDEAGGNDFALSVALSGDLLVVASAEHTLKIVLDRVSGKQTRTLASDEAFQEARSALPDRRFMSAYLDYENLLDAVVDAGEGFSDWGTDETPAACGGLLASTPNWAAMSAGAFERGIVVEAASPLTDNDWPETPELPAVATLLPEDALGFAAMSFNPVIDEWRERLSTCEIAEVYGEDLWELFLESAPPYAQIEWFEEVGRIARRESSQPMPEPLGRGATLADALDVGLWAGNRLTGLDLETDLFNHLRGGALVGVLQVDNDVPEEPLDAVAMLSYRSGRGDELNGTLDHLASLLEDEFDLDFDFADVGADRNARLLDVKEWDDIGYTPGYVLHDGFITFGTTESAIETIVSRQRGRGAALDSDAEYRRVIAHLPDSREFLAYVDVREVLRIAVNADAIDLDRSIRSVAGAAAFSTSLSGDVTRATLAVTLFPDE